MKRSLLLPVAGCFFAFASLAVTPQPKSGAAKLVDFFNGSWEGEETSEVDKKKESGKAWMKCDSVGKDLGVECLLTSKNSPDAPEYWFVGFNQKNESNHIFMITPKSAHDHAAKWISENEMTIAPIANNPDNCSVISFNIKKIGSDALTLEGTEKNKEGKLVTFSVKFKRIAATH